MEVSELANFIDQAALDPFLSKQSIKEFCTASIHYNFRAVCSDLIKLKECRENLRNQTGIKLIAAISFPFGCIPIQHKKAQAEWAFENGANELELVPNFHALKEKKIDIFGYEIATICELGLPVTTVLDTRNLSKEEISLAINSSIEAGTSTIQNSNGFGGSVHKQDIKMISDLTKGRCEIKAVGAIKTVSQCIDVIEAGASRVGTSYGSQLMSSVKKNLK